MQARAPAVIVVLAVGLLLTACGGAPAQKVAKLRDVDAEAAAQAARDVLDEAYRTLRMGSHDGLISLLAPDVYVVGPGVQVHVERSAALLVLADAFDAAGDKKHTLKSNALRVGTAPGGHAAWATDQVVFDGVPFTMTAVLVDVDDLWVISAVHLARPVADKTVEKWLDEGTLAVPGPLPGGVDERARDVVALVEEATVSRELLMDHLAERDDVMVAGRGTAKVLVGVEPVYKAWKKELKQAEPKKAKKKDKKKKKKAKKKKKKKGKKGSPADDDDRDDAEPEADEAPAAPPAPPADATLRGEPRASNTANGNLAWVCVNLDVLGDRKTALPERAFYVFIRDDGAWRLVALHEAVAGAK